MQDYIPQINIDEQNLELKIVEARRLIDRIERELGIFAWEPSEDMPKTNILSTKFSSTTFPSYIKKEPMPILPEIPTQSMDFAPKSQNTKQEVIVPIQQSLPKAAISVAQSAININKTGPQTQKQENKTPEKPKASTETIKTNSLLGENDYPEVKEKLKQLEDMKATVELLRQNLEGMKNSQYGPSRLAESATVTKQVQDYAVKQPAPEITKTEIENLNALIRKLNELINTNLMVANELREIINETRSAIKSTRISELMRRLAEASING